MRMQVLQEYDEVRAADPTFSTQVRQQTPCFDIQVDTAWKRQPDAIAA